MTNEPVVYGCRFCRCWCWWCCWWWWRWCSGAAAAVVVVAAYLSHFLEPWKMIPDSCGRLRFFLTDDRRDLFAGRDFISTVSKVVFTECIGDCYISSKSKYATYGGIFKPKDTWTLNSTMSGRWVALFAIFPPNLTISLCHLFLYYVASPFLAYQAHVICVNPWAKLVATPRAWDGGRGISLNIIILIMFRNMRWKHFQNVVTFRNRKLSKYYNLLKIPGRMSSTLPYAPPVVEFLGPTTIPVL